MPTYREHPPFERNKLYAVHGKIRGIDVLKYYGTMMAGTHAHLPLIHIFGLTQDAPDWNGVGNPPTGSVELDDFSLNYTGRARMYSIVPMKKYHAIKAAEVGTMTGTRGIGPMTDRGKLPRKEADVVLPRDVTRHIAEFAGQGRRRKTKRASRRH